MADAIGVELFNRGFQVSDTNTMSSLLVRDGLRKIEVFQPKNFLRLKEAGIDAFLSVRSAKAYKGIPDSVSVLLNSAHIGEIITALSWQNVWGGTPGPTADQTSQIQ